MLEQLDRRPSTATAHRLRPEPGGSPVSAAEPGGFERPRRSRRTVALLCWLALAVGGASAFAVAEPWHVAYKRAVAALSAGQTAAAARDLEQAIQSRPEEQLAVRISEIETIDYLPYLYLAIARWRLGEEAAARVWLDRAEASGLAARSALAELYRDHAERIRSGERPAEPRSYRAVGALQTTITERELAEVAEQVLGRCGLPATTDHAVLPWYFFYELALELEERGELDRAIEALVEALDREPKPRRHARLYGMWHRDYLPYLRIARLHAARGRMECGRDALRYAAALERPLAGPDQEEEFRQVCAELGVDPEEASLPLAEQRE